MSYRGVHFTYMVLSRVHYREVKLYSKFYLCVCLICCFDVLYEMLLEMLPSVCPTFVYSVFCLVFLYATEQRGASFPQS